MSTMTSRHPQTSASLRDAEWLGVRDSLLARSPATGKPGNPVAGDRANSDGDVPLRRKLGQESTRPDASYLLFWLFMRDCVILSDGGRRVNGLPLGVGLQIENR